MKSGLAYLNITRIPADVISGYIIDKLVKKYNYKECYHGVNDSTMKYLVMKDGCVFKDADPTRYTGIVACKDARAFLAEAVDTIVPISIPGVVETQIYRDDLTHSLTVSAVESDEDADKQYRTVEEAIDVITKNGKSVVSINWIERRQHFVIFYK